MIRRPSPSARVGAPRARSGGRRVRSLGPVAVVVGVVALGLAVVPAPVLRLVEDYAAGYEPLRFEATAADDGVITPQVETDEFVTIGVRLPEAPAGDVTVRWRDAGGWSAWQPLEIEADKGPDPGSAEARAAERARPGVGTEPLWVGEADAYQVAIDGVPTAAEPGADDTSGAEVVLVRPDGGHVEVESKSVAGADVFGKPAIHPRSDWGARSPSNSVGSASSLRFAVIHHSVTGNDYQPGDVPGILRSIQAYHMDSNGWSDIGYNFAVDRFGGIWEARDGSLLRNSIGAHAEGFNTGSVGIVGLGNFSTTTATDAQVNGITSTIAWRFAASGIDPTTTVDVTSGGSSTIPAGRTVTLPRVNGHRNLGATDCPGASLYAAIASKIRPRLPELVRANSSPTGFVDVAAGGPRSIVVSGWALDPLVTDPIDVHLYLDGVGRNLGPASIDRPDLAATFPSSGTRHGFSTVLSGVDPGTHSVCVFGINTGPGDNTLIECRRVVVATGDPIGNVDGAVGGPDGSLAALGWAIDPDQIGPIEVHVYVDGRGFNLGPAAIARDDLARTFPAYGASHGFAWIAGGFAPGRHDVCVFAIGTGPGGNTSLGCRSVVVPGGPPIGVLDAVTAGPDGALSLWGWALDPDTALAPEVHVYVDGTGYNLGAATRSRPDIGASSPPYGPNHGFAWNGTASPGLHRVCVYGIDRVGGSAPSVIGCRNVTVPGGSPVGSVDGVDPVGGGRVSVVGWIIDPDTTAPATAHVYIDGAGYNVGPATAPRPDVAAAKPGYGPAHGLAWTSPPLTPGRHSVCVFGINAGVGANALLDCRVVAV